MEMETNEAQNEQGGVCCWLDLCCPPGGKAAATALAGHLDIPVSAAEAVLKEFRLVPRDVPKVLHEHLDARLKVYLDERGLPAS